MEFCTGPSSRTGDIVALNPLIEVSLGKTTNAEKMEIDHMATNIRHYFAALLKNINPSDERLKLSAELPGEVRDWLKENSFDTCSPHTRLSGSYARSTAIRDIKDVDILLFLPDSQLERTPNAVLREVKKVLDDYPDTTAETSGQRRSVHLEFPKFELHLDIVPSIADQGIDEPLRVPDRPAQEWIDSDPLGYASRLSSLNQNHGGKVVPLVKLIKAWRDVQMKTRRPKSYVLEVMILYAVEGGDITLEDRSLAPITTNFFSHISAKYADLMENGKEAPRIRDPQISNHFITRGWERSHFETFMRRIRDAEKASQNAIDAVEADDDEKACDEWKKVFGDLWPSEEEAKTAARFEATEIRPGVTKIASSGAVVGAKDARISTRRTRYHG